MRARTVFGSLVCLVMLTGMSGCGTSTNPTAPTPLATSGAYEALTNGAAEFAPAAASYKVSGTVRDKNYPAWIIKGVKIAITGGASATTDAAGRYSLKAVAGTRVFRATASGYATVSRTIKVTKAATQDFAIAAVVPSGATARCKDKTWSRSRNRSGTCSHHKGVAYWVCPGPLCR